MEPILKSKTAWRPGTSAAIESISPAAPYAVVFEDDGDTGYLYAVDRSGDAQRPGVVAGTSAALGKRTYTVVDALLIYVAKDAPSKPVVAEIKWSPDGARAALYLGKEIHAVVDFALKQGICRTGFPPGRSETGHWSAQHHWVEGIAEAFRAGVVP